MSVLIPVRRQRKCHISAQWSMCPCHSGMPLVVPFPLRWACLSGVSGRRQRELHGSGVSSMLCEHTDWPFDFVSEPGVGSVLPKAWGCRTNPKGGGIEVPCWRKIKSRASWGCWTASDLRLWTCSLRRVRRLRSLLSRVMAAGRPRFRHRCSPKSGAGSDDRFAVGAQGCGFLGDAPGRKAALRDVRDGCDRCTPGLWQLTDRLRLTCSLWLDISRFLWEAASNLITEGWLRDLALGAIVESPLTPKDAAFLKKRLGGRLARRGHFRRHEKKDGFAGTLDGALLSVLLNLVGDPECVTLERICESFQEAADFHMGTPIGRSTSCQSQVLPQFRQKHGDAVPIRKVVVLGSIAGGQTRSRAAGEERSLGWGFCLFLLERFLTLLVDSGSTPPFGKEWKIIQGKRAQNGRTESNVSRKAKTWIPSPFVPKRLCRFFITTTTNPGHPPQNLRSSPEIH